MDEDKFQVIGNIVTTWGTQGEFKVILKPFLKLNPHKKIKLLFYSNNGLNYLPLRVNNFQAQGNFYRLRIDQPKSSVNSTLLQNKELYSLVRNNEFLNENLWKDYQIVLGDNYYQIWEIWNNGYYDLAQIKYHEKLQWVPLVGEYLNFINHDRRLIYLNPVGVLNEV